MQRAVGSDAVRCSVLQCIAAAMGWQQSIVFLNQYVLFKKEPPIHRALLRKSMPIQIRHPMHLRHLVNQYHYEATDLNQYVVFTVCISLFSYVYKFLFTHHLTYAGCKLWGCNRP